MNGVRVLRGLAVIGFLGLASAAVAEDMVSGYVTGGSGAVVKDSYGNCWRSSYDETTNKLPECGYEEPKPVVETQIEVVAAPTAATITSTVMQKITIGAAMLFGFDSAELSEDAKAVIDERIQTLRGSARLTSKMRIEGHTDSAGPEAYNAALSARRAQAVADYIVSQSYNVKASDIEVVGMGESSPVASNATAEGRADNRRVVIYAEGEVVN
jgi:OOP family OmpA-OmpF porin